MPLPPYYLEVILISGVVCLVAIMMNGWRVLQILFEPFSRSPGGFSYILIITGKVTTLEPVYGPTFAHHGVFFLGGDQYVPDGNTTFEVDLCAIPPTDLLDTFTETLCVRYNNMTLGFKFIDGELGACSALVVSSINNLPGWPVKPFLHLVQSPFWVFTLGECLLEVILLFALCLGPMVEGANNTKFGWGVVVIVLL